MNFLTALGVDSSINILFVIYLVGFLTLYFCVFKPYYKAFLVRKERTVGGEEHAHQVAHHLEALQKTLGDKIRAQREEVQRIFETHKKSATIASTATLNEARVFIEGQRKHYQEQLTSELANGKRSLNSDVANLAKIVQEKIQIQTNVGSGIQT